jgi:probable phosphoglycerate mutase
MPTCTLLLVRHGQTDWNRDGRFRGRADIPLSQRGVEEAEAVARHIQARYTPSTVFSSPLGRAMQTASVIARLCGL